MEKCLTIGLSWGPDHNKTQGDLGDLDPTVSSQGDQLGLDPYSVLKVCCQVLQLQTGDSDSVLEDLPQRDVAPVSQILRCCGRAEEKDCWIASSHLQAPCLLLMRSNFPLAPEGGPPTTVFKSSLLVLQRLQKSGIPIKERVREGRPEQKGPAWTSASAEVQAGVCQK
jgi:hypothetical protein